MLSTDQLNQFRTEGYAIVPNLFSDDEINTVVPHLDNFDTLHERELDVKGAQGISRKGEISFTNDLARRDPAVMAFVKKPQILAVANQVLGPDVALYWDQTVYKRPEGKREFPWHQDNGYTPVDPPEYLTSWIALADTTIENGCIWLLPSSHKQGLIEHKDTPIGKQGYFGDETGIPVPLKKGSVAFFSSLAFHRSGPNLSSSTRKGYIVQYSISPTHSLRDGSVTDKAVLTREGALVG